MITLANSLVPGPEVIKLFSIVKNVCWSHNMTVLDLNLSY